MRHPHDIHRFAGGGWTHRGDTAHIKDPRLPWSNGDAAALRGNPPELNVGHTTSRNLYGIAVCDAGLAVVRQHVLPLGQRVRCRLAALAAGFCLLAGSDAFAQTQTQTDSDPTRPILFSVRP